MRFQGLSSDSTKLWLRFNPRPLWSLFEALVSKLHAIVSDEKTQAGLALTVGYLLPAVLYTVMP